MASSKRRHRISAEMYAVLMPACVEDFGARQALAPAKHLGHLAFLQPQGEAPRDELDPPLRIVREERVMQGFLVELMLGEPAARALVQLRDARSVATQDAAQEIQEQRVIAIPVP